MNMIIKAMLLATAPVALSVLLPTTASAQAVTSVGVANVEEALQRSNAFTAAVAQIKITYKVQIEAFEARQRTLQNELKPLVTAFQTAQAAPNPNQVALQAQATTIQNKQQAAQRELQNLAQPFGRAQAYAEEQVSAKLEPALKAAMIKRKVNLVIAPQATALGDGGDTGDGAEQESQGCGLICRSTRRGWFAISMGCQLAV